MCSRWHLVGPMVGKKKKEVSAPQEEEKQPHGRQIIEVMEGATTKEAKAALFAAGVRERTYRSYMACARRLDVCRVAQAHPRLPYDPGARTNGGGEDDGIRFLWQPCHGVV